MLGLFKSILFIILTPFRWLFNRFCKRRFRKLFHSKSEENIANVEKVSKVGDHTVLDLDAEQSWSNDWPQEDEKAAKIEQYRRQLVSAKESEAARDQAEDHVNFFADMEPQNVRQPKIFVGQAQHTFRQNSRNRLSISKDDASLEPPLDDAVSVCNVALNSISGLGF